MASRLKIVIANKKYSSWSLRGWLGVRIVAGAGNFEEIFCALPRQDDSQQRAEAKSNLLKYSPTGKVPALIDENVGVTVCESLAILMHLALQYPEAELLPKDPVQRALCISAAAEMHAGFMALRQNCPHNCVSIARQHGNTVFAKPEVQADIQRLQALWEGLLDKYGTGNADSFLFGAKPTIADIMYAPVANRFKTYDPDRRQLSAKSQAYMDCLSRMDGMEEWIEAAKSEGPELDLSHYEVYHDK